MATVERLAKGLELGMTTVEVTLMIGSPAEKSSDGVMWVYLPERPAVLIPSSALHLEFENHRLVKFGYRPIILGVGM